MKEIYTTLYIILSIVLICSFFLDRINKTELLLSAILIELHFGFKIKNDLK